MVHDLEVRYTGDRAAMIATVRRALGEVDRNLPLLFGGTLAQHVDKSITGQRVIAKLSAFFGLVAVILACIGIYGLMSYAVTRRAKEIGIRMALGAQSSNVLRMVIRESLLLVALGIAAGLPVAFGAERLVSKLLFGISPSDPISTIGAGALLAVFALLAGYLPARRASRVDPMVALRCE